MSQENLLQIAWNRQKEVWSRKEVSEGGIDLFCFLQMNRKKYTLYGLYGLLIFRTRQAPFINDKVPH
ncbi:MAG: hypothetical protein D3910_18025 [Candidatus Electrothrix sp. ATG2]|nr:hypothetical protein [Candidatus Electrothrix sp. ATG2]